MSGKKEKQKRKKIREWAKAHAENIGNGGPGMPPIELKGIPHRKIFRHAEEACREVLDQHKKQR